MSDAEQAPLLTQNYTASSHDGFIATPDDSLAWLFPLGDIGDTGGPQFIAQVGALAMGATTYEWMLRHVVRPGAADGQRWPCARPCWVLTHRALPPRRITQPALKLVSVRQCGPGFAELRYQVPRPPAAAPAAITRSS